MRQKLEKFSLILLVAVASVFGGVMLLSLFGIRLVYAYMYLYIFIILLLSIGLFLVLRMKKIKRLYSIIALATVLGIFLLFILGYKIVGVLLWQNVRFVSSPQGTTQLVVIEHPWLDYSAYNVAPRMLGIFYNNNKGEIYYARNNIPIPIIEGEVASKFPRFGLYVDWVDEYNYEVTGANVVKGDWIP